MSAERQPKLRRVSNIASNVGPNDIWITDPDKGFKQTLSDGTVARLRIVKDEGVLTTDMEAVV